VSRLTQHRPSRGNSAGEPSEPTGAGPAELGELGRWSGQPVELMYPESRMSGLADHDCCQGRV